MAITKPVQYARAFAPAGSSAPCVYPWKIAKTPTTTAAVQNGSRTAKATIEPSATAEIAMGTSAPGSGTANEPKHPAQGHDQGEYDRQNDDCGCPVKCAPQAHGHHGEHMVGAPNWMGEPARKTSA